MSGGNQEFGSIASPDVSSSERSWPQAATGNVVAVGENVICAEPQEDASSRSDAVSAWCNCRTKRLLDIFGALLLLAVSVPALLAVAIGVWLTSHGPVLFIQERLGQGGRLFRILKFRTLLHASEAGPSLTHTNDPRQTRLGRWLRESKIDELPQLWNVLRGEMSLVGPRPHLPQLWNAALPGASEVLSVRPGLTSAAALDAYREHERLASVATDETLDVYYMQEVLPEKIQQNLGCLYRATFADDMGILIRTIAFCGFHLFTTLKRALRAR